MNSKDNSGNKQVVATDRALTGLNAHGPPSEEVLGEVKRSYAFWEMAFMYTPLKQSLDPTWCKELAKEI